MVTQVTTVATQVTDVPIAQEIGNARSKTGSDAERGTSYRGVVKVMPKTRRSNAHLVTEARRSRTEDIAYRERRYLILMGFRIVCFAVAVVLFTQGLRWLAAIPAIGAIVLPYFAVVFANGGREPEGRRQFRTYEVPLPAVYVPSQERLHDRLGSMDTAGSRAGEAGDSA